MRLPVVFFCPHCRTRFPDMVTLQSNGDKGEWLDLVYRCLTCRRFLHWQGRLGEAVAQTRRLGHLRCRT